MFIFSANNLRSFLWLVCAVLVVGIGGCGSDDEDQPWVGTWSLQTIDGENWRLLAAIFGGTVEDKWTFDDDGTWEMELTLTILGEKESSEASGTYTLTDDTFSMATSDPEFSLDLSLSIEVDDASDSEQSFEITGTWVRDGDTLTLTDSDGQVLVFKKL